MDVKSLRKHLETLDDRAKVLIDINGTAFEVNGTGTENHDRADSPYIVLILGTGHRFGR